MAAYWYFVAPVAVFVAVQIYAHLTGRNTWVYFSKPSATLLVIGVALLSFSQTTSSPAYTTLILAGLALSLVGDIALMFQERRLYFMVGLIFFLLAHVVYAYAFITLSGDVKNVVWFALLFVMFGIAFYLFLYSGLGKMRIPVAIYVIIITVMVIAAASTFGSVEFSRASAWLVTIGAVLFMLSDVVLAVNKFKVPMKYNRFSLILYYGGQFLIAVSTYYAALPNA